MGLIQRWRDQAGEERRAKGLKVSAEKKKKKKKRWRGKSGLAGVKHTFYASSSPNVFSKQNGHACLGLEVKQVLHAKILRVHVPKKMILKSSFNTGKI